MVNDRIAVLCWIKTWYVLNREKKVEEKDWRSWAERVWFWLLQMLFSGSTSPGSARTSAMPSLWSARIPAASWPGRGSTPRPPPPPLPSPHLHPRPVRSSFTGPMLSSLFTLFQSLSITTLASRGPKLATASPSNVANRGLRTPGAVVDLSLVA